MVLGSVSGLLRSAAILNSKKAPRSQLRFLVEQLPKGKVLADLAFQELSKEARAALSEAKLPRLWSDSTPVTTSLVDLVEIYEIEWLGST